MELQKIFQKRLERKGFIYSIGTAIAGYYIFKAFPFYFFNNKKNDNHEKNTQKVRIKINPLAVRRNKIGGYNGRR